MNSYVNTFCYFVNLKQVMKTWEGVFFLILICFLYFSIGSIALFHFYYLDYIFVLCSVLMFLWIILAIWFAIFLCLVPFE